MTTEIKPCPFCGGNPATNSDASRYRVNCANCYAAAWGLDTADAIAAWNRRTPDHIPDARKMIDPMTSVITWTRYDGAPETLPEEERPVCFSGVKERVAILFEGVWVDYFGDFISHPTPGDMWAPMPKPPEAAQ